MDFNLSKFSTVKEYRNGILHGYKKLDLQFDKEVRIYIPDVRKALIIAVSILLNIDPKVMLTQKHIKAVFARWEVIKGTIDILPEDINELVECYPRATGKIVKQTFMLDKDGQLQTKEKCEYDILCSVSSKYNITDHLIYGHRDNCGIKHAEATNGLYEINPDKND